MAYFHLYLLLLKLLEKGGRTNYITAFMYAVDFVVFIFCFTYHYSVIAFREVRFTMSCRMEL